MIELFLPVPEEEIVARQGQPVIVNQELRFNGDREPFVNGDFQEFLDLLSGRLVWLNENVMATISLDLCPTQEDLNALRIRLSQVKQFKRNFSIDGDTEIWNYGVFKNLLRRTSQFSIYFWMF
jgi:hypothetical protein